MPWLRHHQVKAEAFGGYMNLLEKLVPIAENYRVIRGTNQFQLLCHINHEFFTQWFHLSIMVPGLKSCAAALTAVEAYHGAVLGQGAEVGFPSVT
jgi:hypothetical protein